MKIMNGEVKKEKSNNLRKNITISKDDFLILSSFAKKIDISFSELELSNFLRTNYPFASDEERAENSDLKVANYDIVIMKSKKIIAIVLLMAVISANIIVPLAVCL